jgi:hypothetical protein
MFYLSVLQLLLGFYPPYFKNTIASSGFFWPADVRHTSTFEVLMVKFKTLDSEYFFQIVFIEMIITVQIILLTFPVSKNCVSSDVVNKEAKISCLLLSATAFSKQGIGFNQNYHAIIAKLVSQCV